MDALPVPGMLVSSNVRLTRPLGAGGMGSVWMAEHLSLQIDVAVKFISPDLANVPEARARFEREAAAAAQVRNRHVVQIFDRGVTEHGLLYIVMELLVGEDLGKRIDRLGPRPLAEVVTIVSQMARGLTSAHGQGIVHRDIKPDNVFLIDADGDLFVKLLDFGVVKRPQDDVLSVTGSNIVIGTPHFMSPEQFLRPKDVDSRSDLWSVAVVAYVALTAIPPFDGDTHGALCVALNAGHFKPVTRIRDDLPREIDGWFERALRGDPAQRFGSAQEMAAALAVAAGLSQPRLPAFSTPCERGHSESGHALGLVPNAIDASSSESTWLGAGVARSGLSRKARISTALVIVVSSVLSSVATTLFFLPPSSMQGLAGAAHSALEAASEPQRGADQQNDVLDTKLLDVSGLPAQKDAAHVTLSSPIVSADLGGGESVQVQASKAEGWASTTVLTPPATAWRISPVAPILGSQRSDVSQAAPSPEAGSDEPAREPDSEERQASPEQPVEPEAETVFTDDTPDYGL